MGTAGGDTNSSHRPTRGRWAAAWAWLRAHSTHALVVAVAGGLVPVVVQYALPDDPPPATCPGPGCDGRNPQKEGCSADAVGWQPPRGNPVALQVRYSKHCGVLWARILNGEQGDQVTIQVSGGSQKAALVAYGKDQFTPMASVDDTFRATACAVPTTYDTRKGDWKKYCVRVSQRTAWGG
ncbi:DUF2690 domain-containing protein [Streptomyces sp. CA-132043]|uniref:DUF2690 domain-containing protein n=1 Tax=Streptomyces sp. CA-132043 TaxID=3240048 RepID=UPI003D915AE7